ncbi:MAG: cation:proton antiporter [Actinobacteria bacterium]|nr:cation:proton antiporter [Actinomycetota bacterium]MCB8996168.1 cation:proton antiporter [Actinomycetota bacterium]MCB9413953.1 cation:proton antiporter [Actinomycetota bacterium]MCB9425004.1 cation:proton antiporter [Actinomycetota bacterium]HRY09362.1 cation:proton antiporter [Candidatus Nanopelagicales bacterium]
MKGDASFLVELGFLLILLGAAGAVALRVGLSTAPLFLLAGLLIAEGGPVSLTSAEPFLEAAAAVGVVLLLLALGLEFSADEFANAMKRHAPSGVVDFLLNATPGFVFGWLIGLDWPACLAMAGVTWVSSSGIVAKVLSDLNRLGNRETPAVLSVLVLEDIAMAVYLPVLGIVLVGGAVLMGALGAALGVAAVVTIVLLAQRGERIAERLLNHDDDEQVLLRVLGLTLLVAGAAELLGVSSAVGAFLVGLAIPPKAAKQARRVMEPLRDLFAAVFFLAFASQVDLGAIPAVLPEALGLMVVTLVTKVITGWYAAGREQAADRGRMRAGTVLVARGEFSIVIAGLAVTSGFAEVGVLTTTYVLLLAVIGPILTRFSDQLARPWVARARSVSP